MKKIMGDNANVIIENQIVLDVEKQEGLRMIYIQKKSEPDLLLKYRYQMNARFDDMDSDVKKQLRDWQALYGDYEPGSGYL